MKTKRNFSIGIKIASILSAVAILSIGFASWLIVSAPNDQTYADGSFTVQAVEMKSATISGITSSDSSVVFGKGAAPSGEGVTNYGWLKATDVGNDDLNASFSFTLTSKDGKDPSELALNEVLKTITIVLDTPDAFDAAVADGYLGAPTVSYSYGESVTASSSNFADGKVTLVIDISEVDIASIDVTLNLTFAWGTNGNPFTYYNAQAYTPELASEAFEVLDAVYGLKDAKYSITISGALIDRLAG
ncbi:MAG: hypothetical protein J6Q85_07375 [Clostridia bacterium]|nr:hypothetical protein [Clostridia bacterium]